MFRFMCCFATPSLSRVYQDFYSKEEKQALLEKELAKVCKLVRNKLADDEYNEAIEKQQIEKVY